MFTEADFHEDEHEDDETDDRAGTEDSLRSYFDEVARFSLLSREDEIRLARRAVAGDGAARERLVEANLRLVVAIARRYQGLGLDMLDLIQEGNLGLMKAAERYDGRPEVKFATYASFWIRRSITRALSNTSRSIRLPVSITDRLHRVNQAERALTARLGRAPSVAELAGETGYSESLVARLRTLAAAPRSLAEPVGEEGTETLADAIADQHASDPAVLLTGGEDGLGVVRALHGLDDRSRRVLELRFGFDGDEPRTTEDVAVRLGVSRERARRIEQRALRALSMDPHVRGLEAAA